MEGQKVCNILSNFFNWNAIANDVDQCDWQNDDFRKVGECCQNCAGRRGICNKKLSLKGQPSI